MGKGMIFMHKTSVSKCIINDFFPPQVQFASQIFQTMRIKHALLVLLKLKEIKTDCTTFLRSNFHEIQG